MSDRSVDPTTLAGDPFVHAGEAGIEARRQAISAAYERAQFAEEEAGFAERVGEDEAAEYWRIQADRAERKARRLEEGSLG